MLKGCTPKHKEIHGTCKYIPLRCRGVRKALGQITCFVIANHISKYIAIPGCRSRGVGRRCSWCSMHQVRQCKPLGHVIIRPLQTNKRQACLSLVLEDSDTGVKIVPVHHPQTVPLLWAVRLPLAREVCGMHTMPLKPPALRDKGPILCHSGIEASEACACENIMHVQDALTSCSR